MTINAALTSMKLELLMPTFQTQRMDFDAFLKLEDKDLQGLGIYPKARKKILKWIKRFKKHNQAYKEKMEREKEREREREKEKEKENAKKSGPGDSEPAKKPELNRKKSFMKGAKTLRKLTSSRRNLEDDLPSSPSLSSASSPAAGTLSPTTSHRTRVRSGTFMTEEQRGSIARIKDMIERKGLLYRDDKTGQTLLHKECNKAVPSLEAVEYLLKMGVPPNLADKEGWTALHTLCKRSLFVDNGQSIRALSAYLLPLHFDLNRFNYGCVCFAWISYQP
jgi:Sec-independent protein translocase protein TatA